MGSIAAPHRAGLFGQKTRHISRVSLCAHNGGKVTV
jgi:hypothetical protein